MGIAGSSRIMLPIGKDTEERPDKAAAEIKGTLSKRCARAVSGLLGKRKDGE